MIRVLNNRVKQKLAMVYYKSENPIASLVFLGESVKVTQNLFSADDTICWSVLYSNLPEQLKCEIFTVNYIISYSTAADAKFET